MIEKRNESMLYREDRCVVLKYLPLNFITKSKIFRVTGSLSYFSSDPPESIWFKRAKINEEGRRLGSRRSKTPS